MSLCVCLCVLCVGGIHTQVFRLFSRVLSRVLSSMMRHKTCGGVPESIDDYSLSGGEVLCFCLPLVVSLFVVVPPAVVIFVLLLLFLLVVVVVVVVL